MNQALKKVVAKTGRVSNRRPMYSWGENFSTRCQSRFLPGQGIQKIQRETYRESIRIRKRANEAVSEGLAGEGGAIHSLCSFLYSRGAPSAGKWYCYDCLSRSAHRALAHSTKQITGEHMELTVTQQERPWDRPFWKPVDGK